MLTVLIVAIVIAAGHGSTDGGQVTDNYSDIASSAQELNDVKAKCLEVLCFICTF